MAEFLSDIQHGTPQGNRQGISHTSGHTFFILYRMVTLKSCRLSIHHFQHESFYGILARQNCL
jgi:hypothetical protein